MLAAVLLRDAVHTIQIAVRPIVQHLAERGVGVQRLVRGVPVHCLLQAVADAIMAVRYNAGRPAEGRQAVPDRISAPGQGTRSPARQFQYLSV